MSKKEILYYDGITLKSIENADYLYVGEDGFIYSIYESNTPFKKRINYSGKYPTVKIKGNKVFVKNIIAKHFVNNINDFKYVLYKTEDYSNNKPSNIKWSSNNGSNRKDKRNKYKKGTTHKGFTILEELSNKKLKVRCTECNTEKVISRSINKKCNCDKSLKLNLPSENKKDFKTWKIISEDKDTENLYKKDKIINLECSCGRTKTIMYKYFIKSKFNCKCQKTIISEKEDKNLRGRLGNIIQRCNNKNNKAYNNYGGRGIKVCKEWLDNSDNFLYWSKLNGYNISLEIDRIDNDKGYSPENCRWVSKLENSRNQRTNKLDWKLVEEIRSKDFKDLNYKEIGEIYNISGDTISNCLNYKTWVR